MIDEDLGALHHILRRKEPQETICIGNFTCCAGELFWVVEEAMSARAQAKASGTYKPFRSPFAD